MEDEELRMEDLLHLDNHFRILAKTPSRLIPKCSATSRKIALNVPGLSGLKSNTLESPPKPHPIVKALTNQVE